MSTTTILLLRLAITVFPPLSLGCSVITMTRQPPAKPVGREITATERRLMKLHEGNDEYKLCDRRGTCAAVSCTAIRDVHDCRYFGPPEVLAGYLDELTTHATSERFVLSEATAAVSKSP